MCELPESVRLSVVFGSSVFTDIETVLYVCMILEPSISTNLAPPPWTTKYSSWNTPRKGIYLVGVTPNSR